MDPYGEKKSGPVIGRQSVAANLVGADAADTRGNPNKRQKAQRTTSATETTNQGKQQWSATTQTITKKESSTTSSRPDTKCTRCWNRITHTYKDCSESKCVCGKPLAARQVVCYNYDAHPSSAQFKEKIPRSVSIDEEKQLLVDRHEPILRATRGSNPTVRKSKRGKAPRPSQRP